MNHFTTNDKSTFVRKEKPLVVYIQCVCKTYRVRIRMHVIELCVGGGHARNHLRAGCQCAVFADTFRLTRTPIKRKPKYRRPPPTCNVVAFAAYQERGARDVITRERDIQCKLHCWAPPEKITHTNTRRWQIYKSWQFIIAAAKNVRTTA